MVENFVLKIRVVPNADRFALGDFDPWTGALKVWAAAAPDKGKANAEIIKELEKFFEAKATIVSGEKARTKEILIEKPKDFVLARLANFQK